MIWKTNYAAYVYVQIENILADGTMSQMPRKRDNKLGTGRLLQNIDISKIIDIKKILNIHFRCESIISKYKNSDIIDGGKNIEVFEPKQSSGSEKMHFPQE